MSNQIVRTFNINLSVDYISYTYVARFNLVCNDFNWIIVDIWDDLWAQTITFISVAIYQEVTH